MTGLCSLSFDKVVAFGISHSEVKLSRMCPKRRQRGRQLYRLCFCSYSRQGTKPLLSVLLSIAHITRSL